MKSLKKILSKILLGKPPGKPLLAALVFISRLGFLPANFSPVGGFGFFGKNLILLALVTFGFDYLKGGFYQGVVFTYLGFLMYPLLGYFAKGSWRKIVLLPIASFLFFLLSNLGVWYYWYDHTWQGLIICYSLALPFYQRTLMGDLVFGYGFLALRALATFGQRARTSAMLKIEQP